MLRNWALVCRVETGSGPSVSGARPNRVLLPLRAVLILLRIPRHLHLPSTRKCRFTMKAHSLATLSSLNCAWQQRKQHRTTYVTPSMLINLSHPILLSGLGSQPLAEQSAVAAAYAKASHMPTPKDNQCYGRGNQLNRLIPSASRLSPQPSPPFCGASWKVPS